MPAKMLQPAKWTELANSLTAYRPRRSQRYAAVNVLLLYWKDADIPSATDAKDLDRMFRENFNYRTHCYEIPSSDQVGLSLTVYLSQFLKQYGGADHLVLIHYGGHGEGGDERSSCTWACKREGGPSLNWALIQPLLLNANCDVALFVDCCCAGQAARPHLSQSVEFLAAGNKDQWTPSGRGRWPSFTQVLIERMPALLKTNGTVTLPDLQAQMVRQEAGLCIQPFYVPLSQGAAGKIQLRPWLDLSSPDTNRTKPVSEAFQRALTCQLEVTMYRPLDVTSLSALMRWLTKDSPTAIEDIRIAQKSLEEADMIEKIGEQLLAKGRISDTPTRGGGLPNQGWEEVTKLLQQLRDAIDEPAPEILSNDEAMGIVKKIKTSSSQLAVFIEDSIQHLRLDSLKQMKALDAEEVAHLRSRVAMRLKFLEEGENIQSSSVRFDDQGHRKQRFRIGRQGEVEVLVEYYEYDAAGAEPGNTITKQVARVAALHLEPKPDAFRTLPGIGYTYESLHGHRYGFIHRLPDQRYGNHFVPLSDLIRQGKTVPLDVRLKIAAVLCEALIHLHSVGWLHKSIKSENVVLFSKEPNTNRDGLPHDDYDFERPYLFGFDVSRPQDAESRLSADFSTKDNLYRHPDRWGNPTSFQKHHDLYAMGLLLVEIGRWKLLGDIRMDSKGTKTTTVKKPEYLRDFLLRANLAHISHSAGTQCAEAVKVCLERRSWTGLEDWQYQRVIRNEVLARLKGQL